MIQTPYRDGEWDFPALYESGAWEPETKAVLERFLKPGDLFVDVGAWCGPVSLWALDLGAQVLALEPDPKARETLRTNTAGRDIRVLPRALAATAGLAILAADNYFGDSQSRLLYTGEVEEFHTKETLAVMCLTPRQLFQQIQHWYGHLPTLIKVDIEGGEAAVMPRLGPLCSLHRIPLLVAWHQDWWPVPVEAGAPEVWFDGMDVTGAVGGWGQSLAVPA